MATRTIALLSALAILMAAPPDDVKEQGHPHQRAEFVKKHPCPATGKKKGACPGYVVDHIKPLCAGGADHPSNMQWQTRKEAKIKDRREAEQCRRFRSQHYGR